MRVIRRPAFGGKMALWEKNGGSLAGKGRREPGLLNVKNAQGRRGENKKKTHLKEGGIGSI